MYTKKRITVVLKWTKIENSAFQRLYNVDNIPRKNAKSQNYENLYAHSYVFDRGTLECAKKKQEKIKLAKQQKNTPAATKTEDNPSDKQSGVKRRLAKETENQEPSKRIKQKMVNDSDMMMNQMEPMSLPEKVKEAKE